MGNRIFVFVDESGLHTQPDSYVVAALWCLSGYADTSKVLEPTRNRVSNAIGGIPGGEIRGSDMGETTLDSVLRYFPKVLGEDDSVRTHPVPWATDCPVAYTVYDSDGDINDRLTETYLGEGRSKEPAQLVGLASVVSPLLCLLERMSAEVESSHVVLDAKTWERPSHTLRTMLDGIERAPECRFVTRDSRTIPGIQFADVAANARRRRLYRGKCVVGSNTVDSLRL